MAKKVQAYVKLQIGAGSANPAPPVGPALGQQGVNIMEFCKAFNANTQSFDKGSPIPVVITVYSDKSFTFILKTPPASYLIKKTLGLKSASHKPGTESAGKITHEQLIKIVEQKSADMNGADAEASAKCIAGTARSMGIQVEG